MPPVDHDRNSLEGRVSVLEMKHDGLSGQVQRMEDSIASLRDDISNLSEDTRSELKGVQNTLQTVVLGAQDSMPKWAAEAAKDNEDRLRSANKTIGVMMGVAASLLASVVILVTVIFTHMA